MTPAVLADRSRKGPGLAGPSSPPRGPTVCGVRSQTARRPAAAARLRCAATAPGLSSANWPAGPPDRRQRQLGGRGWLASRLDVADARNEGLGILETDQSRRALLAPA